MVPVKVRTVVPVTTPCTYWPLMSTTTSTGEGGRPPPAMTVERSAVVSVLELLLLWVAEAFTKLSAYWVAIPRPAVHTFDEGGEGWLVLNTVVPAAVTGEPVTSSPEARVTNQPLAASRAAAAVVFCAAVPTCTRFAVAS